MNGKIILEHLGRYKIERLAFAGGEGLSITDEGTVPPTATVLFFDENGTPDGGRLVVDVSISLAEQVKLEGENLGRSLQLSAVLDYFGLRGGTSGFAQRAAQDFAVMPDSEGASRSDVEAAAGSFLRASGLEEITNKVSRPALDALACVSDFGRPAYAFYAVPGDRGDVRRQAASAYPLFAGEMATKVLVKMAVDQKRPLAETLVRAFGVNDSGIPRLSKGLLRKIGGRHLPDRGVPVQVLVNALSELPIDWFPKEGDDWNAFTDIADAFFRRFGSEIGQTAGELSNGASGKWQEFAGRLAKSYVATLPPDDLPEDRKETWEPETDVSREAMLGAAQQACDVLNAFRNYVILPLAAHAGAGAGVPVYVGPEQLGMASEIAGRVFYGGKSLTAMLESQRRWHTQAHNIVAATERQDDDLEVREVADDGWAPMCDTWEAPNGVTILPLTDPRELKEEGAALRHCVGGFSASCKAGTSHILSFRVLHSDGTFRRLSTVEFGKIDPNSTSLEKIQHHGHKNGAPPHEAKVAYDWFVNNVASGVIPLNHGGVMAFLAGRRRAAEEVDSYCVFDWRDEDALARAIEPWRPFLSKRLRSASVAEMMEMPELQDLVQSVAPAYASYAR